MPITTTIDPPLPGDSPEVFDAKAFAAFHQFKPGNLADGLGKRLTVDFLDTEGEG